VTTPYAVVLNNDAQPDPDWLEQLLAGFEPGVAAVTSKVLLMPRFAVLPAPAPGSEAMRSVTVDGRDVTRSVLLGPEGLLVPVPEGRSVEVRGVTAGGTEVVVATVGELSERVDVVNSVGGFLTASGHGADRGYLEVDRGQYDVDEDVPAVCGAAAAFRTDAAAAAGWFDPWLFAYYEDLDLSWRLRRAGWRVRYVAAARVRHHHAATSRVGSDVFLFHNRRNRLATLARNATVRELLGYLAGSLRARQVPAATTLDPDPAAGPLSPPPRGRSAALASFLGHLPVLLLDRVTDRSRRRKLGATPGP
jgi:cellulose synthase/poly-beta-1,6-N-acetylglucosamine synthase-like glycosyltransferase